MRYFITGIAGFIGSHLARELLETGAIVSGVDNLSTGSEFNLDSRIDNFEKIDIREREKLASFIDSSDVVIHLAATLGVKNIMEDTLNAISTNIDGSRNLLELCASKKVPVYIASTSEIYGKNPKQPLNELDDRVLGTPQNIRWSYSDSKAIEEAMANFLALSKGLKVTTLRFFNTVGPGQSGMYGMVVPRLVKNALENKPIEVYGTGEQTRVFCHVLDVVSAMTQLLTRKQYESEVFNVGGEGEISINELARKIKEHTNSTSSIVHVPYKEIYPVGFEDMQRRVPDTTKLRKAIGWSPKYDIDDIIRDVAGSLKSSKG